MLIHSRIKLSSYPLRMWVVFALLIYCLIPFETDPVDLSIAIRMIIAAVLTIIAASKINYNRRSVLGVYMAAFTSFIVFIMVSAFVSFSFRFFATISALIFAAICTAAVRTNPDFRSNFILALRFLIYLSVGLFFAQIVWWQLSGTIIQFHDIVFPFSSGRTEDHELFVRLGGMYIEPGTHAHWLFMIYLVYLFASRSVVDRIAIFVGASLISTVSVWGAFAGLLLILLYIMVHIRGRNFFLAIIVSLLGLMAIYLLMDSEFYQFIERKLLFETESGVSKVDAYNEFGSILFDILFIGNGFNPGFCENCLSPQDAGLFLSISVVFGVLFSSVISVVALFGSYTQGGITFLALTALIFTTKLFYWDYVFWMAIFLLIPVHKQVDG